MDAIKKQNTTLKGVLPKDYGRASLDKQRLGELIDLIGTIGLGDADSRSKDILGTQVAFRRTSSAVKLSYVVRWFMARELVNMKARLEFRELLVGWTLREIGDEFAAAGIRNDSEYVPPLISGQRRTLVEQYYHTLDFSDPGDVEKLLLAYENILTITLNKQPMFGQTVETCRAENAAKVERLVAWLRKDGFEFENGRITRVSGSLSVGGLHAKAAEFNADYMTAEIKRIERAVTDDPALAIGAAKELVETCCKTILAARGKPVTDKPDVQPLVRRTCEELQLTPDGIPEDARGAKVIKGILGNLSTITQNLAELRNLYGTGHGKDGTVKGLTARHARLAVGAAVALVEFLFDTHTDRPAGP
ncbi:MAG TPA: abortive infection family protein [Gemmataceae bacterium]|nr:abortive infection family protein [Gemmataceae bacterium]